VDGRNIMRVLLPALGHAVAFWVYGRHPGIVRAEQTNGDLWRSSHTLPTVVGGDL
jgi:hypothetical protein